MLATAHTSARAQSRNSELARLSQNSLGSVLTVPVGQHLEFGQDGPEALYGLELRGLGSLPLGVSPRLVPRVILPFTQASGPSGKEFGLGDTRLELLFASSMDPGQRGAMFGIGPALIVPTSSGSIHGDGRWAAGLSFAQTLDQGPFVLGLQLSQLWSFAGPDSRRATAPFIIEPAMNYNMHDGWALVSEPEIRLDWYTAWFDEGWSLPLGGGVAKTWAFGSRGVTASLTGYGNLVHPVGAPTWTVHAKLALLHR
jgi:hypothetical protein